MSCTRNGLLPKTCLVLPDGFGQSVLRMHKGPDQKPADAGTAEAASGGEAHASLPALTGEERGQLLALARRAIAASLRGLGEPEIDVSLLPPAAALPHGCFVTLTVDGELRGCIGNTVARLPLHRAIVQHAIQAAREDRRFESITSPELDRLEIELSILSAVRPLRAANPEEVLRLLRPHRDGVLLRVGPLGATYLPQVWEKIPDPGAFMASLSRKAGLSEAGWRDRDAQISIYEVLAFSEKETAKPDP